MTCSKKEASAETLMAPTTTAVKPRGKAHKTGKSVKTKAMVAQRKKAQKL